VLRPISYANGRFVDTDEVSIPFMGDNLGTLRGYRLFTSCRTVNGKVFHLDDHVNRLFEMAQKAYMPMGMDRDELIRIIMQTVLRNRAFGQDLLVLIVLSGGKADASGMAPVGPADLYVITSILKTPSDEVYHQGLSLALFPHEKPFAEIKFLGYTASVVAELSVVRAHHADAPLFYSYQTPAQVLEGSTFNVFGVKDGVIITPPIDGRILAGITREILLDLARQHQISIEERPILVDELLVCDELFISSSTRGAVAAVRVDQHVVGTGRPGPVTQLVHEAYNKYLAHY